MSLLRPVAKEVFFEDVGGTDYLAVFNYKEQNVGVVTQGDVVEQSKEILSRTTKVVPLACLKSSIS